MNQVEKIEQLCEDLNTALSVYIESLLDTIDGLESDLEYAVEVAYNHGARDFVKLNHPTYFNKLENGE